MKIAVIGAGAMGSLFGSRLAMSGQDITMVDVVPSVIEAINKNGIRLEDAQGDHVIPLNACRAEEMEGDVDLAILFTKTIYSRSALESAKRFLGAETYVLSLQNGLGNIELIEEFVPASHVLVGVTNLPSDLVSPGHIRSHGDGIIKFMSADGCLNSMVESVNNIFLQAGLNSSIQKDVMVSIWEKVAFNAAINSTTAVCRVPCGAIGRALEGRELAFNIARETAAVANAHGVKVSAESIIQSLTNTFTVHETHFTSMAQDILHKRATEVSSINGGIVAKAKEVGMSVPFTETLFYIIRTIEQAYDLQA